MRISSTTSPAKRVRAKVKADAATLVTATTTRKPRSTKKPAAPAAQLDVEAPSDVEVLAMHPSPDELAGMIATTAYFIAAQRNFAPGQELDDWLEAERRVRSGCAG